MEWQSRQNALIGEDATGVLAGKHVLVLGAGGVGSAVIEALARAGIGRITVVDHDTFAESNLNRQLLATTDTVGRLKAECAAERILSINPACVASGLATFVTVDNAGEIIASAKPDYIVDAIDNVTAKLALIESATSADIPIISCMGTGNRLDPTAFSVCDIYKTSGCPLARVMRRELRSRGIRHCRVLASSEEPRKTGARTPASISFVPATAGFIIAGEVIKSFIS